MWLNLEVTLLTWTYCSGLSAAYGGATSSTAGATNGRRTSGQRMMTPPSHPSSVATNTSPSARYYTGQEGEAGRHASPYQPASAPPQILSHQFNTMTNSPQTAQGYPQYQYNQQSHQQNPTQWGDILRTVSHRTRLVITCPGDWARHRPSRKIVRWGTVLLDSNLRRCTITPRTPFNNGLPLSCRRCRAFTRAHGRIPSPCQD